MAIQSSASSTRTLYEQDYCLWIETTINQLRDRQLN
ncbi:MAG: DUF29 family protein [Microcystaceae cyanobacterium]